MLSMLLALTLLFGGLGTQQGHARLTVTSTAPFTVHGVGFRPAERVTLTLAGGNRLTRVVVTNAAGRFTRTVTLFRLKDSGCPAYGISARGSKGSIAFVKSFPECANPGPVG